MVITASAAAPAIIDALVNGNPTRSRSPTPCCQHRPVRRRNADGRQGEGGKALIDMFEVVSNALHQAYRDRNVQGRHGPGIQLYSARTHRGIGMEGGATKPRMLIVALSIFTAGHLMIFILAILSAGLHGIRLQYVELFKKFYEGGGVEFNPLKIKRKHTVEE